jgi:SH3 domain protein
MNIIRHALVFILLNLSFTSLAEDSIASGSQGFITEDLFIYTHAGPGKNYRILGTINAGTKIQLTGLTENSFSQITNQKNKLVWVEDQYLSNKPGLRFVVAELNAKLAGATDLNKQLDSQLNSAKAHVSNLNGDSSLLNNEISELKKQLITAQSKLKTQDTDIQKQWFFTGAIVLGIGLILGLILPRLGSGRKRSSNENWG